MTVFFETDLNRFKYNLAISRSFCQNQQNQRSETRSAKSKMAANFDEAIKSSSDSSIDDSDVEAKNAAAATDSSPFSQLPAELVETILRNLDFISLANARLVSRRWNESVGKLRLCLRIKAPSYDFIIPQRDGDWLKQTSADAVKQIDGRTLEDLIRQLPTHLMDLTFEVVLRLDDKCRNVAGILNVLCAKLNHRCKLRLVVRDVPLSVFTNNPQPGARIADQFPNLSLKSLSFNYKFPNDANPSDLDQVADFLRTSGEVHLTLRDFGKRGNQVAAFCDRFPDTTFLSFEFAQHGVVAQNWNTLTRFSRLAQLNIVGSKIDEVAIPAFAESDHLPALRGFSCRHVQLPPHSNFFNAMPQLKLLQLGRCNYPTFNAERTNSDINEVISALANAALKNLRTATLDFTRIPPEASLAYLKRVCEAICRYASLCPKFKLLQWSGAGLVLSEVDHLGEHLASLPANFFAPLPFTLELSDRQSVHHSQTTNLEASLTTLAEHVQRTGLKQLKLRRYLNYAMGLWSEVAADINSKGSLSAAVKKVGPRGKNPGSDAEPILRIITKNRFLAMEAIEIELLIFKRSEPADASAAAKTE